MNLQLSSILTQLSNIIKNNADYTVGKASARQWMVPTGYDAMIDRSAVNTECIAAFYKTRGALDGKLIEVGYLSGLGRSFILRHQTPARIQTQVAGRQYAHSNSYGIINKVGSYINTMEGLQ